MPKQFFLQLSNPGGTADRIALRFGGPGAALVMGSAADADLRVSSSGVEARQCLFQLVDPDTLSLENLGAVPTRLNGRAIHTAVTLRDGDRIEFGDLLLVVEAVPAADVLLNTDIAPVPESQPVISREPPARVQSASASAQPPAAPPLVAAYTGAAAPGSGPRLRPALRPVARPQPGSPATAPDASSSTPAPVSAPAGDDLVARSLACLRAEIPLQAGAYSEAHLRVLIERGRATANTLGFMNEDHVNAFLRCMILVGDELASSASKCPDVYFSLTLPNKPPEARLERALKVAHRINSRGGVTTIPIPGVESVAVPASDPPSASSSSISRQVSEEMMPQAPTARLEPRSASAPEGRDRDVTQAAPSPGQGSIPASVPASASQPAADEPARLPEIPGFRVLEKIGSGGMGTVYRAYHERLEVEVAIKVFKTLHPDAKSLLLREARAAARLQHPNIVQVLDYQEYGRGAYYAMQLVKGVDAHDLVQRVSGRMVHEAEADGVLRALGLTHDEISPEVRSVLAGRQPWHRLVAWWMAGVADGLDRAHREGIIHRDIKPSNLLLARDGRMTITDFGLALRRDNPNVGNTARAGTPRYLAPERIADWASGADLSGTDGRIDIWAIGATLYELLTYRPAYDGSREAVLRDIVTLDPLPPSQVVWAVPQELDRICLQAMKRDPEERFQQAGEMASALRAWLVSETQSQGRSQAAPGVFTWFRKGTRDA